MPLQLNGHHQIEPGESAESSQGPAGDVRRSRSPVQQPSRRQTAGDVEQMVVPVAETARQLHQRPRQTTSISAGCAARPGVFLPSVL